MLKKKARRMAAAMMAGILTCSLTAVPVKADSISETEQRGKELQKQKEAAENEKSSLASQLNQVISDMQETEKKLTEKQDEIKKAQDELVQAQNICMRMATQVSLRFFSAPRAWEIF